MGESVSCLYLSTLESSVIFLVEGRKKWVKRNIPGIIYCYFTTTLGGLTWVKFFFLILSVYVFEKRRIEVRWYIITKVYKENECKRRKVTGQLKKYIYGKNV